MTYLGPVKISPDEIRKVKKTLLLNLVVADLAVVAGLLVNQLGGHQWQTLSIALIALGAVWVLLTVSKIIRFRRFLSANNTGKHK